MTAQRRPTLTDCGCEATVYEDGSGIELHYCPLHAAAPDLKAELIAYHDREWTDAHEGLVAHSAGDYPEQCGGCAAIAKATQP